MHSEVAHRATNVASRGSCNQLQKEAQKACTADNNCAATPSEHDLAGPVAAQASVVAQEGCFCITTSAKPVPMDKAQQQAVASALSVPRTSTARPATPLQRSAELASKVTYM